MPSRSATSALFRSEGGEHVLDEVADLAERIRRRHADAQAGEVFADRGDDRAHPVVSAGPAFLAKADLAERQIDLIEHHEQIRGLDAVPVEELADGATRIVHERLWPRYGDTHAIDRALGDTRVGRLHRELGARALREA